MTILKFIPDDYLAVIYNDLLEEYYQNTPPVRAKGFLLGHLELVKLCNHQMMLLDDNNNILGYLALDKDILIAFKLYKKQLSVAVPLLKYIMENTAEFEEVKAVSLPQTKSLPDRYFNDNVLDKELVTAIINKKG